MFVLLNKMNYVAMFIILRVNTKIFNFKKSQTLKFETLISQMNAFLLWVNRCSQGYFDCKTQSLYSMANHSQFP